MQEKRRFSRVTFCIEAVLKHGGQTIRGEVQNISLDGMFIKTGERIPPGETVEMTISLAGDTSTLTINLEGRVSRALEDGIALQYRKVDLDSFIHLRNIVSYNIGDAERVLEEFHSFIEESVSSR